MKKNIIYFILFSVFLMVISSRILHTEQGVDHVYAINDTFVNMYFIEKNDKYIAVDTGNNR